MKKNTWILRTQLNIAYLIGVFILLIFSGVLSVVIYLFFGIAGIIVDLLLITFAIAVFINFFKNMRTVYFFEDYLVEKYFLKRKITVVPYGDITQMSAERVLSELPRFSRSPVTMATAPGDIITADDRIIILTEDGKKILISAAMFDNYSIISSFIMHNLVQKKEDAEI